MFSPGVGAGCDGSNCHPWSRERVSSPLISRYSNGTVAPSAEAEADKLPCSSYCAPCLCVDKV